jgi:orotidine-5'-phosphate decarboxylase
MRVLRESGYPAELARINSSSGLTHPWARKKEGPPADWDEACVRALETLNEEIAYEP